MVEDVVDQLFSSAVVTYVWGHPHRAWPSLDSAAVRSRFDEGAAELLQRVQEVFSTVDAAPLDWHREDLTAATARIRSLVRAAHPQLDDAAIQAVGSYFAYSWR